MKTNTTYPYSSKWFGWAVLAVLLMLLSGVYGILFIMYHQQVEVPVKSDKCPVVRIDTIYNYIDGKEPLVNDMAVRYSDLLRDTKGCLINQEVVIAVWWSPLGNNSEIIN